MPKLISVFNRKPKAMVFVDYEYWFYSYKNNFKLTPNLSAWRNKLEQKYTITDIMIFADFSSGGMDGEPGRLREVTNTIIETRDVTQRRKKDMTDFVMLDYIYQCVDSNPKIDTYIIFTGDGHFQSVIKYLVQKKRKEVVLYGIAESFSRRLTPVATDTVMLPSSDELYSEYSKFILQNLSRCDSKRYITPTFKGTVEAVSKRHGIAEDNVRNVLSQMIEKGYIYQRTDYRRKIKTIFADWNKLIIDGLWDEAQYTPKEPKKRVEQKGRESGKERASSTEKASTKERASAKKRVPAKAGGGKIYS